MEIEYDGRDQYQVVYAIIPGDYVLTADDFNQLQMLPPQDLAMITVIRDEKDELTLTDFTAAYCNAAQKAIIRNIIATYRDWLTNVINAV